MVDPMMILKSMGAAAGLAIAIVFLFGLPWRQNYPIRFGIGGVLGVGAGFYLGCWFLGTNVDWKLNADQGRLMWIVWPAAIVAELVAAILPRQRWIGWLLRLVVAAGAARVLLDGSQYITDHFGPGSRLWTEEKTWQILGGLGIALALVWSALVFLERKSPGSTASLVIGISSAAAAITVAMSGAYASGGLMGFPLAAVVVGAGLAGLLMPRPAQLQGVVGLGVVGLFSLLLSARFFASLNTVFAALLFFSLLLCWLPEVPARFRGVSRLATAAIPATVIAFLAYSKFQQEQAAKNPEAKEKPSNGIVITNDDYANFGK